MQLGVWVRVSVCVCTPLAVCIASGRCILILEYIFGSGLQFNSACSSAFNARAYRAFHYRLHMCACVWVCAFCLLHFSLCKNCIPFFFLGTFFRFLFAFFEMHSTQIARFGSCIFCVQNAIALGWIFQLCSISPPFAPHFNDIFGGFCRICLRGFNFNCLVRHSFIFFFHISLRLRCTFSFRQVRVVCMLSPILSFVNTAIICVPWWRHYVLKFCFFRLLLVFVLVFFFSFFGHTCAECLSAWEDDDDWSFIADVGINLGQGWAGLQAQRIIMQERILVAFLIHRKMQFKADGKSLRVPFFDQVIIVVFCHEIIFYSYGLNNTF